jgi:hypothetical protein
MQLIQKILVAFALTVLFFVIYKFVMNPRIMLTATNVCPNGWEFQDPMCIPPQGSACKTFDPSKMGKAERIKFMKKCGPWI